MQSVSSAPSNPVTVAPSPDTGAQQEVSGSAAVSPVTDPAGYTCAGDNTGKPVNTDVFPGAEVREVKLRVLYLNDRKTDQQTLGHNSHNLLNNSNGKMTITRDGTIVLSSAICSKARVQSFIQGNGKKIICDGTFKTDEQGCIDITNVKIAGNIDYEWAERFDSSATGRKVYNVFSRIRDMLPEYTHQKQTCKVQIVHSKYDDGSIAYSTGYNSIFVCPKKVGGPELLDEKNLKAIFHQILSEHELSFSMSYFSPLERFELKIKNPGKTCMDSGSPASRGNFATHYLLAD